MGHTRKYLKEFKEMIAKEYFEGARTCDLSLKYGIPVSRIKHWRKQYKELGSCPDGRGKAKIGRPKLKKVDTLQMTKDEYIEYLEMENDILKYLTSLKKKNQK